MDWMTLSPEEWTAVRLSLRVALVATLVSLPFGIAIAMALARGRFWGHALLNGLVLLPLILPPVVTGYILLILFGRRGPIGAFLADHFGIVFSFRWTGAALACGVMGFPLLVRAIRLSIEAVDARLEEAAGTLGASRAWVFLTVTLPLIVPGIIAGMILCFAKAMGEFGATITFVSNIPGETQTLPSAIYTFTQVPGGDAGALRLTLVSVAIAMLALLASELMARTRQPAARHRMTLAIDIRHRLGDFLLDARFETGGGLIALFGRSGSGKTSIINIIAGLIRPEHGRVAIDDVVLVDTARGMFVPRHRRRIGYVFQEGRLFPHLTVRQNLLYGRWFAPQAERGDDLDRVVDLLGIGSLLERRPGRLSGGEKQRVAIGRALLANPRLLLMDEPLASLDEARKAEILPYIERLRDQSTDPDRLCQPFDCRGGAACLHRRAAVRGQGRSGRADVRDHAAARSFPADRTRRGRRHRRGHGGAARRAASA